LLYLLCRVADSHTASQQFLIYGAPVYIAVFTV
jgi:hypothetical protein